MSLRICRHCRKPVSLAAERCPHCKGKLNREQFLLILTIMAFLTVLILGIDVYAVLVYRDAYEAAYCKQHIYARAAGPEDLSCGQVCEDKCTEKKMNYVSHLLLTTSLRTDRQTQISCECTCTGC